MGPSRSLPKVFTFRMRHPGSLPKVLIFRMRHRRSSSKVYTFAMRPWVRMAEGSYYQTRSRMVWAKGSHCGLRPLKVFIKPEASQRAGTGPALTDRLEIVCGKSPRPERWLGQGRGDRAPTLLSTTIRRRAEAPLARNLAVPGRCGEPHPTLEVGWSSRHLPSTARCPPRYGRGRG